MSFKEMTFGQRVRGLRKTMGLTQVALAKAAGIKQSSLSSIESGETTLLNVRDQTVAGMASALKVDPEFLRTGEDSPVPPAKLSLEEKELIDVFRSLRPATREHLLAIARQILEAQADSKATKARPFTHAKV